MSIRQGSNVLAGYIDYHPDLFDCKWSDHIIDNICWLRGDTFSWQDGTVYSAAYQHLVADMSDSPVQETEYATPNVSLMGTANITPDGVLQGFSTTYSSENSYAIISGLSSPSSSLEMIFKLQTPPSYTVNSEYLLDIVSTVNIYKGIVIRATSATNIRVYASSNGSSWDIMNGKDFTCDIPTNTNVWVKLTWDGSTYTLYTSTNGSTYTSIGTQSSSSALYLTDPLTLGGSGRENYPFVGGKIDLKESYIDVDGSILWQGANFITYTKTGDGHRIVSPDQIDLLTDLYNRTGVAWYYVLDTTNSRFKLPRTKFGFNGLRDSVGKFIEPGSPEISGTFTIGRGGNSAKGNLENITGAFTSDTYTSGGYTSFSQDGNSPDGNKRARFNASISNGVYGNSNTVQPPATQMYLYFYVGNFTQTAIENTAGLNESLFNGKADLDLANVLANIDYVVESQLPTAENNYTWYRKYRSGWVEQGGQYWLDYTDGTDIVLPIPMSNVYYYINASYIRNDSTYESGADVVIRKYDKKTTSFKARLTASNNPDSTFGTIRPWCWEVKGMAA